MLKGIKKKLKKAFTGVIAAMTIATSFTLPTQTVQVQAAASFTSQNFYDALAELTGVPASTLSNPSYWSEWKYLPYPVYGSGAGGDMTLMTTGSFDQLKSGMLDCIRFGWAATGHAMKNAGLNPTSYLTSNWYPSARNFSNIVGFEVTTDISKAEPGDLIEFGPQAHMGVVLGWNGGQLWQIDGSSPGNGPVIKKYTGYASSGGSGGSFYRLYHFPHTPPSKEITVSVKKSSSNTNITADNSEYSLAGAKFAVHSGTSANGSVIGEITTDASGNGSGKFTVANDVTHVTLVETVAPKGFKLDSQPQTIALSGSNQATVSFSDTPETNDLTVVFNKYSANLTFTSNNNAYSLEGAKYEIAYLNQYGTAIAVDTITTDANGHATKKLSEIPLGTTTIQAIEKTAPKGYKLNSDPIKVNIVGTTATFSVAETPITQELKVEINKSSDNPSITDGNPCYSLEGAVYQAFYQDQNGNFVNLGTLTTNKEGKASAKYSNIPLGITKVRIKEITAPKSYYLDDQPHDVNVSNGKAVFNVKDTPGNDPLTIQIQKQSEDPIENPASLAGAEFTVKYYAVDPTGDYTADQLAEINANKTWVIATKYNEFNKTYWTTLHDDYKVSGDDFYKDSDTGAAVLPIGVVTVQETKAPDGYTLENSITYQLNENTNEYEQTNGVAIFKVAMDSDVSASVITKNNYLYTEGVSRGGLKIQKHDSQTGLNPQGNATDLTAYYKIRNLNNYNVAMKINGNIVATAAPNELFDYTIVTDTNGYWETSKNDKGKYDFLQAGTADDPARYRVEEVQAPTGYVIESNDTDSMSTTFDFTLTDNQMVADATQSLSDDVARGGFRLYKNDTDFGSPTAQGDTNLQTTYKIVNRSINAVVVAGKTYQPNETIELNGDGNKYFTTDTNGYYEVDDQRLPYGTYEIIEVQAPTGYKVEDKTAATFTITEDHQMYDLTKSLSDPVVTGEFSIYKHYNKQNKSEWDDKPEEGAEFLAILTSKLNTVFNGDMFDAYNKIVDIIGDDLKVDGSVTEEGSEANRLYTTYGISPKEFSILKTDAKGKAKSGKLAYGTYTIHQIKGDVETIIVDDNATFEVKGVDKKTTDSDGMEVASKADQELIEYSATNDYKTYQLNIVKRDANTGKKVTLNGASFKIGYDSDNDGVWTEKDRQFNKIYSDENKIVNGFVVQTVSGRDYDTFRTYSDNNKEYTDGTFVVNSETEDKKGVVTTPVKVRGGNYFIFEMDNHDDTVDETPWGYVTADPDQYDINGSLYNKSDNNAQYPVATEVQLTETHYAVMKDGNSEKLFADDEYAVTTLIKDKRALGELTVHKTIEDYEADTSLINREDLSGFGFELRAKGDIFDPADGSIIVKQGELAKSLIDGEYVETGRFNVDSDGNYVLKNIPLGSYELTEVEQPEGTVTNKTTYPVDFIQPDNDRTTETFPVEINIENKTTKIAVSKKSLTGDDELPGATLTVKDSKGNVIDTWIGTNEEHTIEGLSTKETYELIEEAAPEGYVIANSIKFTLNDTSQVQNLKMVDKTYTVIKTDADGSPVIGATLAVIDEDGHVVDYWTTDGNPHRVNNLIEGKTYTLREIESPEGFVKTTDKVFTVTGADEDGKKVDQEYSLTDKQVSFSKVDVDDHFVNGATLEAYEYANGEIIRNDDGTEKVVDRWVSGDESHNISNLVAGKTYVVREVETPDGYVTASDILIEVADDESNQEYKMIDMIVEVFKTDVKFNAVEGAEFEIVDENGNVVDSWTSDGKGHKASGLVAGTNYLLRETKAPEGYVKAADIHFTTSEDATNKSVTMINQRYSVSKVDVAGEEVIGAEMNVTDTEGNVIDEWVSDGTVHYINNLEEFGSYSINEKVAADGYVKATSIPFTVNSADGDGKKSDVHFDVVDKIVSISKVDVAGEEVKGATMTVTDEEGNVIDEWVSDGSKHNVNGLEEGKNYTIHEKVTADGYVKATDIPFTVKGADEDGNKEDEHFDVVDKIVTVSKKDMGGTEIAGAELTVTDEEGNVIDSWTSDGTNHKVNGLEEEKDYYLNEVVAPEGYVKATTIKFRVTGADEKGVKVDQNVDMTDKKVTITKTDGNGTEVPGAKITITDEDGNVVDTWVSTDKPHEVKGLEAGKNYTWHEDYGTIFGYYYAEDYTFTVTDDGIDQNLEMVDKPIKYEINKIDDQGNPVTGVTLELYDITKDEEGNYVTATKNGEPAKIALPNDGVTTGKPFELVNKLMAGHTYALEETEIVAGVYKTGRVEFTVDTYNPTSDEPVVITMVDSTTAVSIRKLDEKGNAVKDAKIQIIETEKDENGKVVTAKNEDGSERVVYEFTTTDEQNGTDISKYVKGGETYIARETEAPFGFEKAEDTEFTVSGENGVYQVIVITDKHADEYITINKVDSKNTKLGLSGAEFELRRTKDDSVLATGKTGKDGKVTFKVTWADDDKGYYVVETKSPNGYKKTEEKYVIPNASKDAGFDVKSPVVVTVTNEKLPKTGVNGPIAAIGMLIIGLGGMLTALRKDKKKKVK